VLCTCVVLNRSYNAEAALAVKAVQPDAFWQYCEAVWDAREAEFIDDVTVDLTRNQIYDKLADIAAGVGADRAAVREKLNLKAKGNMGTWVTQDLKYAIQHHRKRGVHVTPTVFVNG
jgi:protein-disulfide isomerase